MKNYNSIRGKWYWLVLSAVLFLPIYGRFLVGWSPVGGDIVNQYLPYQELIRESVQQGQLPLYNAKTFCGRPLMADIQVGVLYPPNWLHWILPLPISFALTLALHGFWMIFGCFMLGRYWKFHPAAITLAAVLFCANPFFILRLSQGVILFIYAGSWWPWMALSVARLVNKPCFGRMAVFTLCTSMSLLAGSPQITFYGWIGTCVLAFFLTCRGEIRDNGHNTAPDSVRPSFWKPLGWVITGFAFTTGLTALQTFQTLDFIGNSFERAEGAPWEYITNGSLGFHLLWLMINPSFLGVGHSENAYYFGSRLDFAEACQYMPAWTLFIILPLTFELMRGNRTDHVRQHSMILYAGLISITMGVCLSFGKNFPLFSLFFNWVPGFDKFRVPARLMIFTFSGMSLVCLITYHRLLTREGNPCSGRLKYLLLFGVVAGLITIWVPYALRDQIWEPIMRENIDHPWLIHGYVPKLTIPIYNKAKQAALYNGLVVSLGITLVAFALWKISTRKPATSHKNNHMIWALPILALVELVTLSLPFYHTSRISRYIGDQYPDTPLINILKREHRGGRILWLDDVHSWLHDQNQPEIYPNRLVMHGLPDARGYDPVNARWIGEWMNLLSGRKPDTNPRGLMIIQQIARPPWLTLMGVETVLTYTSLDYISTLSQIATLDFDKETHPGIQGTANDEKVTLRIYRNDAFRGLAFPAPMPKFVKPGHWQDQLYMAAKLTKDPNVPFQDAIITDIGIYPDSAFLSMDPNRQPEDIYRLAPDTGPEFKVEELQAGPNTWRYRVNYPEQALTCFSHSAWDGWNLKINGRPASLARMNGTFLAAAVPAGESELELFYRPPGLSSGIAVSLIALVTLIYGCIHSRAPKTRLIPASRS